MQDEHQRRIKATKTCRGGKSNNRIPPSFRATVIDDHSQHFQKSSHLLLQSTFPNGAASYYFTLQKSCCAQLGTRYPRRVIQWYGDNCRASFGNKNHKFVFCGDVHPLENPPLQYVWGLTKCSITGQTTNFQGEQSLVQVIEQLIYQNRCRIILDVQQGKPSKQKFNFSH